MIFEFQGRCYNSTRDFMHDEVLPIEVEGKALAVEFGLEPI